MKRMLRLCLCIMVVAILEIGCQQGVTDVGNPTINQPVPATTEPDQPDPNSLQANFPSIGDLLGTYELVAASNTCDRPQEETPRVILGSIANQIVLFHFLSYSPDTQYAGAIYQGGAFSVSDASVDVSCVGAAVQASGTVPLKITLDCKVGKTAAPCSSTFTKIQAGND